MMLAFIFVVFFALVLILRLFNLQITHYDYYTEEALGNQMRTLPITPTRGKIFDRNGKVLATNQLAYKLTLTPENLTHDEAKTLLTLEQLGFINDNDIKAYHKNRKRYKKFHNIPLKHNLREAYVAKFLVSNQFAGVEIEIDYPYKGGFHLLGLGLKDYSGLLTKKLITIKEYRDERNKEIIKLMKSNRLNITLSGFRSRIYS
jgi:cell division protein FtsI/penicillin-binding protein 2